MTSRFIRPSPCPTVFTGLGPCYHAVRARLALRFRGGPGCILLHRCKRLAKAAPPKAYTDAVMSGSLSSGAGGQRLYFAPIRGIMPMGCASFSAVIVILDTQEEIRT